MISAIAIPTAIAMEWVVVAAISSRYEQVSNRLAGYVIGNLVVLGPPIAAFIAAVLVTRLAARVFRKGTHED